MSLPARLDGLYQDYNRIDSASDPIHKVRPFARAEDREVAGFCAGALAFGRVASVLNSIDALFALVGPRPADFVRGFDPEKPPAGMRGLVHRWIRGDDLVALLWILRQMLEQSGSIEGFFLEGYRDEHEDIGPALDSFSTRALALDIRRAYGRVPRRPGVCYFFPRPSAGSACKRLNLFLRWMVRTRRSGSRSVDEGAGVQTDRPARHARHPARSLSAPDTLRQPRVEDGCRYHSDRCAASIPTTRSASISRSVTSE